MSNLTSLKNHLNFLWSIKVPNTDNNKLSLTETIKNENILIDVKIGDLLCQFNQSILSLKKYIYLKTLNQDIINNIIEIENDKISKKVDKLLNITKNNDNLISFLISWEKIFVSDIENLQTSYPYSKSINYLLKFSEILEKTKFNLITGLKIHHK